MGAIFAVAAGNVNGGLVQFFHGLQVAIMMTVMTNVVQFAWWTVKRKRKNEKVHCKKYGPVYLLLVASVLVCVQPMSMLVIGSFEIDNFFFDGGDFHAPCKLDSDCGAKLCLASADSDASCEDIVPGHLNSTTASPSSSCVCAMDSNALVPNTPIGWSIQIFGTYLGFILLFIGVFQATQLHKNIAKKWRAIRSAAGTGKKKKPAKKKKRVVKRKMEQKSGDSSSDSSDSDSSSDSDDSD